MLLILDDCNCGFNVLSLNNFVKLFLFVLEILLEDDNVSLQVWLRYLRPIMQNFLG